MCLDGGPWASGECAWTRAPTPGRSAAIPRQRVLRLAPNGGICYRLVEAVAPIRFPVFIDELRQLRKQARESPALLHRRRERVLRGVALHPEELSVCPRVLLR